jgi:hypothetical protein
MTSRYRGETAITPAAELSEIPSMNRLKSRLAKRLTPRGIPPE